MEPETPHECTMIDIFSELNGVGDGTGVEPEYILVCENPEKENN